MNTTSAPIRVSKGVAALAIVLTTLAGPVQASDHAPAIVGIWTVQVTLRNCDTQAPIGPPFNALVTIHADGTISEGSASLAFAPGQRTNAQGVWRRIGSRTFKQSMISLLAFDTPPNLPASPGFFAGWQTVEQEVRMIDEDHLRSTGTNQFFKVTGESYRTGCSTAVGQRFE